MANEAVPETRASTFHQNNSKKQPTTPLRRISRRSLSALSASRSREADDGPVLTFLEGVFAELSEAIEDLAVNFEALDAINEGLDGFNEGFAGLLYGLRMNAYTSDFIDVCNLHYLYTKPISIHTNFLSLGRRHQRQSIFNERLSERSN